MHRRPVLVNASRGGLVVEEDLERALDEGLLRGAAFDVALPEPPPADSTIMRLAARPGLHPHPARRVGERPGAAGARRPADHQHRALRAGRAGQRRPRRVLNEAFPEPTMARLAILTLFMGQTRNRFLQYQPAAHDPRDPRHGGTHRGLRGRRAALSRRPGRPHGGQGRARAQPPRHRGDQLRVGAARPVAARRMVVHEAGGAQGRRRRLQALHRPRARARRAAHHQLPAERRHRLRLRAGLRACLRHGRRVLRRDRRPRPDVPDLHRVQDQRAPGALAARQRRRDGGVLPDRQPRQPGRDARRRPRALRERERVAIGGAAGEGQAPLLRAPERQRRTGRLGPAPRRRAPLGADRVPVDAGAPGLRRLDDLRHRAEGSRSPSSSSPPRRGSRASTSRSRRRIDAPRMEALQLANNPSRTIGYVHTLA